MTEASATATNEAGRFRTRWQRVADGARGLLTSPRSAVEPGPQATRRNLKEPIVVPGQGYVFPFTVSVGFIWSTDGGLTAEALADWAEYFLGPARRRLERTVAGVACNHPPHRPNDVQVELDRLLGKTVWTFDAGGVTVHCRPHAEVRMDDRVRAYLEPIWERAIKLESEHELDMRRAHLLDERTEAWLKVLTKLRGNPLLVWAARLADVEFSEVVREANTGEQSALDRLVDLLEDALRRDNFANAGLGSYELAELFDVTIQEIRRHSGYTPSSNGARGGHTG